MKSLGNVFVRIDQFCLCKQINSTLFWFISAIQIETKHDDLNSFYLYVIIIVLEGFECEWFMEFIFDSKNIHKEISYFIEWKIL